MKHWPWFIWLVVLTFFQAGLAPAVHAAGTNAVIPYKELDEMFQTVSVVDPAKLQIHMFISSTNKAVHPSDIRLTIHSAAKGLIPVQLDTNGLVVHFPLDKDLRRENPPVVANQPVGTLQMVITAQIPPSDDLTFRYRRLADGVAEMNRNIKAQAGLMLSLLAPRVEGVAFLFPKASAGKAKVQIASVTGKKEYTADRHGNVILKLDKALVTENPEVTVSEKPEHIVPDMSDMK